MTKATSMQKVKVKGEGHRGRIIKKFSGVITKDQGNVHAKRQGQRSKIKVTEVTTQLSRFRTVTPG